MCRVFKLSKSSISLSHHRYDVVYHSYSARTVLFVKMTGQCLATVVRMCRSGLVKTFTVGYAQSLNHYTMFPAAKLFAVQDDIEEVKRLLS